MPSVLIGTMADTPTFVDTNVLVYAHDASDLVKQPLARAALERLWVGRAGITSTQVLQEFYSVATTRMRPAMRRAAAREIVSAYSEWSVVLIEPALILNASMLQERHRLSFWDALIIESARVGGASRLLTEDLQHGQVIAGVRIEDPFQAATRPRGIHDEHRVVP
jgi:predicted nucleic acid-binding protein